MTAASDTIAAPATARGRAALSIIRVSGPSALSIASSCFQGDDLQSAATHTAHFGRIVGADKSVIDHVVATVFKAPNTATGEDLVEITCHGGDFAPQLVLESLIASGARMADPGEFTLRSFLNNKLDLTQAEAVADVIHASSTSAHRVSMSHLEGHYSKVLEELRLELVDLGAMLELELDFSEEDVDFADKDRLKTLLRNATSLLSELINSYRTGLRIKDGIKVVIAGRPNAGKSTLLNALVGKDRSIVSPIPGTTRDEIESEIEVDGMAFKFLDTAGLRVTSDVIEREGVKRTMNSIAVADIVLFVYDATESLDKKSVADIQTSAAEGSTIVVIANKSDLASSSNAEIGDYSVSLSALKGLTDVYELAPLIEVLKGIASESLSDQDGSQIVTNLRHKNHLANANEAVIKCLEALESGASGDLISIELRHALRELGSITGEITNEDILDSIFSRFCIGK